ncbi:MAG: indolepyruvate ferredoxin oxidoreductase [Planctomycetota bacterium]|nr:MAG: indolepyruvate ferredoxin oxidoreductase [Planctomycetota bacterium]
MEAQGLFKTVAVQSVKKSVSAGQVLLGDEAVALGAVHAGVTASYAYPGTPSTEILEFLIRHYKREGGPKASWCANEKTAYEEALGVSMMGRRALVAMKHVGLNVAADPFMNSAIVSIHGGLVVVVADDPGMHSSQNEQDSRYLADFARVPCLEPANQQEAYDMTRQAFELSERFQVPVVVRLVTRLAHSRAVVRPQAPDEVGLLEKPVERNSWILLPAFARKQWRALLDRQPEIRRFAEESSFNRFYTGPENSGPRLGVLTTGVARNYYLENLPDLEFQPTHLHIGAYPAPAAKIQQLMESVEEVLVLEEGYPFLENQIRGLLPPHLPIHGKLTGALPLDGELNPDLVRKALGLPERPAVDLGDRPEVARPPQLCQGCPHSVAYAAIQEALASYPMPLVASDIGCYTLGALPPYSAIESCVCMGASIGMAKGAADAGLHPALAVIGDSTFLHSGVTPLMDAVAEDADITVLILDNETVAMTGSQPTILPSQGLRDLVQGLGVDPEHFHWLEAHPKQKGELTELLKREIAHRGLSVIVTGRECLEKAKLRKRAEKAAQQAQQGRQEV